METNIIYTVEAQIPSGKIKIKMIEKPISQIVNCEKGKTVGICLKNGETHTGIFKGMDGTQTMMIGSFSGQHTLGYEIQWIQDYLEEK